MPFFRLVEVKTGRLTINIVKFRPSSGPGRRPALDLSPSETLVSYLNLKRMP